jgi:uncharacterized protein (TIGR02271 family)
MPNYSALSQYQNANFPAEMADVRGFEVRTRDGDDKVGTVEDLVCTADGQLRYLDVALGGLFTSRHVVLPVGAAQVDRQENVVWITGMTKDQVKALPDYTGDVGLIDDGYETQVTSASGRTGTDADLYDQGRFYAERGGTAARDARLVLSEEQLVVGKRQVQAGEATLRKTVETEHVRETVPLVHEEVTIERHPISADASRDATIGEDSIRVPLMAEEAVVDKRVVAKEEVTLNKRAVTEERVIEEDLRRERLVADGVEQQGVSDVSATRGRTGGRGLADRAVDALDDVKDRVDGNPASRPGRDATDSRI